MISDLERTARCFLSDYLREWESITTSGTHPLDTIMTFHLPGKGGRAKESRRNGRSQVLVEDLSPDSDLAHQWLKNLRELIDVDGHDAIVIWADTNFDPDKSVNEAGTRRKWGSDEFHMHWRVGWAAWLAMVLSYRVDTNPRKP